MKRTSGKPRNLQVEFHLGHIPKPKPSHALQNFVPSGTLPTTRRFCQGTVDKPQMKIIHKIILVGAAAALVCVGNCAAVAAATAQGESVNADAMQSQTKLDANDGGNQADNSASSGPADNDVPDQVSHNMRTINKGFNNGFLMCTYEQARNDACP